MADTEGIKMFLYTYLQKNHKKLPEYSFKQRALGRGHLRFICEVWLTGFLNFILLSFEWMVFPTLVLEILQVKKMPRQIRLVTLPIFLFARGF